MYLVSPEYANKKPPPQPKSGSRKKRVKQKQHLHDKWVNMCHEMREADISRKALIQKLADFLQNILPGNAPVKSKILKPDFTEHPPSPIQTDTTSVWASPASLPSTSHEIIYETPKRSEEEQEDEGAGYVSEPEVAELSTKHFGSVASPYVSSYAFSARNVDKVFGIRREADGTSKYVLRLLKLILKVMFTYKVKCMKGHRII